MDEEKKGLNLSVLISLLVGVISLIVIIPTISMIMNKTNLALEYEVKYSLDTSSLVEADFDKTQGTVSGQPTDVYTLTDEEFKLVYTFPSGEPFSLTYTNINVKLGLNLVVTTNITPIESLAYLSDLNLIFAVTGVPGFAYFNVGNIGIPTNYVIEIIQFV